MIVLALDTSFRATSVAVLDGETVLAARSEAMERGHQERLAGLVRDADDPRRDRFRQPWSASASPSAPAPSPALRVGLAFAKGLALALSVPASASALWWLASSVETPGPVAAVIDARRGQVYLQIFQDGAALGEPQSLTLPDAEVTPSRLASRPLTLVGSGAAILQIAETAVAERLFQTRSRSPG